MEKEPFNASSEKLTDLTIDYGAMVGSYDEVMQQFNEIAASRKDDVHFQVMYLNAALTKLTAYSNVLILAYLRRLDNNLNILSSIPSQFVKNNTNLFTTLFTILSQMSKNLSQISENVVRGSAKGTKEAQNMWDDSAIAEFVDTLEKAAKGLKHIDMSIYE